MLSSAVSRSLSLFIFACQDPQIMMSRSPHNAGAPVHKVRKCVEKKWMREKMDLNTVTSNPYRTSNRIHTQTSKTMRTRKCLFNQSCIHTNDDFEEDDRGLPFALVHEAEAEGRIAHNCAEDDCAEGEGHDGLADVAQVMCRHRPVCTELARHRALSIATVAPLHSHSLEEIRIVLVRARTRAKRRCTEITPKSDSRG